MKLAVITAHYGADSLSQAVLSWGGATPLFIQDGSSGMLPAYDKGWRRARDHGYTILAHLHDDVLIHEPHWEKRVLREFEDPQVGLVGFGGALAHGDPQMYRVPYEYYQLGRSHFRSNMVDAEVHGERFTGECDVAVLDGFALIVRRSILESAGGWPRDTPINYVGYDYFLSCITRRLGYRIRLVGVQCAHLGGRTFVKQGIGQDAKHWQEYLAAHQYIYREFRDVLPWSVT